MMLSGGDLVHGVRLTWPDQHALQTGTPLPDREPAPTDVNGPAYSISEWQQPFGSGTAWYYPHPGLVRLEREDGSVWLRLDRQRQQLLQRYTWLARAGLLPEEPTPLQVLALAARQEAIALWIKQSSVDGLPGGASVELEPPMIDLVWGLISEAPERQVLLRSSEVMRHENVDLVFVLPEQRAVTFRYVASLGILADLTLTNLWEATTVIRVLDVPEPLQHELATASAAIRSSASGARTDDIPREPDTSGEVTAASSGDDRLWPSLLVFAGLAAVTSLLIYTYTRLRGPHPRDPRPRDSES